METIRRHSEPWIKASPPGEQERPENPVVLKAEIERRWGRSPDYARRLA